MLPQSAALEGLLYPGMSRWRHRRTAMARGATGGAGGTCVRVHVGDLLRS